MKTMNAIFKQNNTAKLFHALKMAKSRFYPKKFYKID